jgi:4-amino-4-deoxy-L-arabinose transferase-like glycosyltransferase
MARVLNSRFAHYILLLTVTAALTFPGLGAISLWDIDEGLNAEAAREMLESGDWVVPTFNFKPRTSKPALLYWLQALAYQQFGVNEFSARLPSVLAAAAAVLLTYELGRRMFSRGVGVLAGVIAISTIQVSVLAHAATPDALLLAALMLTIWLFWTGAEHGSRRWTWAIGLGCGIAVLAKGPVGAVMPGAIIGYYFLARRQGRRLLDVRLLAGIGLTLVIAGPWYALVGAETRGRFLRAFWETENVGRFLAPMEGHSGSAAYYPLTVLIGLAPWSILLLPVLWDACRSVSPRTDEHPADAGGESAAVCFLICWVAVYVGFFSLAQTKLPNYILPAYPPLALLTARFLLRWRAGLAGAPRWMLPVGLAFLAVMGVGVAGGMIVIGGVLTPAALASQVVHGLARWAWIGAVPILGAAAGFWCLRRGWRTGLVASLTATAVAFIGLTSDRPLQALEARKACRPLVAAAGACRPADEIRIAYLAYFQPSLVFYCRREVSELYSPQQALDLLGGPLPAYVFCPAEIGDQLALAGAYRIAGRQPDLYRRFDVVVVTNQR